MPESVGKTVFILGAGTSASSGVPLMANFLDAAEGIKNRNLETDIDHFNLVFAALNHLQTVQIKSKFDTDNLESVFGAFEMAALLGRFGTFSPELLARLPLAMRRVICRTVELSMLFPVRNGSIHPPAPYNEFASVVSDSISRRTFGDPPTIISFNYDVGVESGFYYHGVPFDFCLEGSQPQSNRGGTVEFLKLHGSIAWARCETCDTVTPLPLRFDGQYISSDWALFGVSNRVIQSTCRVCNKPNTDQMIVPPTFNKTRHYQQIQNVWRQAAKRLAEAENIVVIGFSLPPSDDFFHHLYALGTVGDTRIKKFLVINPDGNVAERFERLLGPSAQRRFGFEKSKFEDAIGILRRGFEIPIAPILRTVKP